MSIICILYVARNANIYLTFAKASIFRVVYNCYYFNNFRFLLRYAMRFSIVRSCINRLMHKIFETALNFEPAKLTELREKSKQQVPDFTIGF